MLYNIGTSARSVPKTILLVKIFQLLSGYSDLNNTPPSNFSLFEALVSTESGQFTYC